MIDHLVFYALALAIAGVASFVWRLIHRRQHHKKLLALRDRIENVYIVSMSESGEIPNVGEISAHCWFVEPDKMHKTYIETMHLLRESGNRFFEGETTKAIGLKVLCFYFQDGCNVNEDFNQFGERVKYEIMADRSERHEALKQLDNEWYKRYHHNQNVIEWKIKKPIK